MVIPTSHAATVLLLVLALVCFALWPNFYKQSQARWRFELFSIDFALGALLLATLAAYTLGTLGAEMSFTDRMLIAGRAPWIWLIGTGALFTLGNMLLLPSITVLGLAAAFAVAFGTAGIATALLHLRSADGLLLGCGVAFMGLSMVAAVLWSRRVKRQAVKGVVLAILSGLAFAGVEAILRLTADPEFGPGPYATVLMMAVGLTLATPAFNFFFMNIKVIGSQIGFANYRQGGFPRHVPGLISGAVWGTGLLSLLLALSITADRGPGPALTFLFAAGAVLVCILLGLFRWNEATAGVGWVRILPTAAALCFAVGSALVGYGLASGL